MSLPDKDSFIRLGGLLLLSVALLSLASAPIGLWPLAWVALTPWFVAIGQVHTMRSALVRGWLTGALYFAVNLWWLWTASVLGTIVLVAYFALYWSLAAGLIYGLQLLGSTGSTSTASERAGPTMQIPKRRALTLAARVVAIAVVWVAAEWLRCNVASGFAWLPIGCTQSPFVVMCQVADFGGPWIVSWWVVLPSALVAVAWSERNTPRHLLAPSTIVLATLACVTIYGAWRLHTTNTIDGPRVIVIQTNISHLPGGAPSVERERSVELMLRQLERLIGQSIDLAVLPEAALPPINLEARRELIKSPIGPFLDETHERLLAIARENHAALLVGGNAVTGWTTRGREHIGTEIRNSAYLFDPQPDASVERYDKIYLARFSERAPLTLGPAWLRSVAMRISANRASQPLHAGTLSELRPFRLRWQDSESGSHDTPFITPICLENIDPAVIARMMRASDGGRKRADFIANVSNDGWFASQEKHQHLQTTIFRCIENRVPMARSSNTGISCFIDSCGRVTNTVAANTSGFAVQRIQLDDRQTFYTRYGDVFPLACVALVGFALLQRCARRLLAFARGTRAFA